MVITKLVEDIKDWLADQFHEQGRFYVYMLIDPRFGGEGEGRVFYVGKGEGDRVFQHEKDTRRLLKRGTKWAMSKMSCKHKRILEIWDDGFQVQYSFPFRTNDEEAAYQYESRLIDHFGLEHLTNATYGYRPKSQRQRNRRR